MPLEMKGSDPVSWIMTKAASNGQLWFQYEISSYSRRYITFLYSVQPERHPRRLNMLLESVAAGPDEEKADSADKEIGKEGLDVSPLDEA